MLLLGIMSICQVTFLPGYILIRLLGIFDGIIKTSLFSFTLSLIINHFLVVFLTAIGCYNRPTLVFMFAMEIAILCWFVRGCLNRSLSDYYGKLKDKITLTWNRYNFQPIDYSVAIAMAYYSFQFFTNIGNVFDGWDPVMSWNRWAIDWYNGNLPRLTWHYPQLLPSNWSMTYMFLGTCEVQLFATVIMPLFPLFSLLSLYDLWKRTKEPAYGYAVPALALTYVAFLQVEINQGYADYPVAFMSFMAIYALLLLDSNGPIGYTLKHLLAGIICCAGAALTKQAGLFLVGIYPLLCFLIILFRISDITKSYKLYLTIISYLLLAVMVAPWYVFIDYRINKGIEQSEVSYVTNEIYHGANILSRGINSLSTIVNEVTSNIEMFLMVQHHGMHIPVKCISIICLLFLVYCIYRGSRARIPRLLLVLAVIPFYVIWTLYFSYGLRNLALILPIVGVIIGHGITTFNFRIFKELFWNRIYQHKTG